MVCSNISQVGKIEKEIMNEIKNNQDSRESLGGKNSVMSKKLLETIHPNKMCPIVQPSWKSHFFVMVNSRIGMTVAWFKGEEIGNFQ